MEVEEFLRIKKKLDEAKNNLAKLEGRKESLLNQLEEKFQCENEDEARDYIQSEQRGLEKLNRKYEKGLEDFKAKYGNVL